MLMLENFDEIESASNIELNRLLQRSKERNRHGRMDKRIARIQAEIEHRKKGKKVSNVEYILTNKGAFTLKYDFLLVNTAAEIFIAEDLARIAIEDNTDPTTLNREVQEALNRFYSGVSVELNPELDKLIEKENERIKEKIDD